MNPLQGDPHSLTGRVILITGATAGIGRSIALAMAQLGATTLLLGRDVQALEKLYDDIIELGCPEPGLIPFDLSAYDTPRLDELKAVITERYGELHGLIHNAAILGDRVPFEHYTGTLWDTVMKTNFEAPTALTRALLPLLRIPDMSALIFLSSSVGVQPRAYWGAYAASKYALEGLAILLSEELENTSNIRINVVNPGATQTGMRRAAYPAEDPSGLRSPETLTNLFAFLIAPDSGAQKGQRYQFDGSCEPLTVV
jgi:NAD(P)-dependent dehydrogenase (short-subunit alcohol dehydrogenase family)